MKRLIIAGASSLLLALPAATLAAGKEKVATIPVDRQAAAQLSRDPTIPYTFAALRYEHAEYDNDLAADGFVVEGSYLILSNLFAVGSYALTESDEIRVAGRTDTQETNFLRLGAGYRYDLTRNFDLVATLQGVQAETKAFDASDEETGFEVAAGVRGPLPLALLEDVEGRAGLAHLSLGNDETFLDLSALYTFGRFGALGRDLAAGLGARISQDTTAYGATARWAF